MSPPDLAPHPAHASNRMPMPAAAPAATKKATCPRCAATVHWRAGSTPMCPHCGYGRPAAGSSLRPDPSPAAPNPPPHPPAAASGAPSSAPGARRLGSPRDGALPAATRIQAEVIPLQPQATALLHADGRERHDGNDGNDGRALAQRQRGAGRAAFAVVLLALSATVAWAAYAWLLQVRKGLGVTGLNEYVTWGIYIVNFVFLIGLSAGGILVAGLANVLRLEKFRPIARIAEVLAFLCLSLAGLSILMSMGRPDRAWELFVYARPGSPLVWDVFVVFTYMALTLGLMYFATRADLVRTAQQRPRARWLYRLLTLGRMDLSEQAMARDRKWLRRLSIFSIPYAVVLHSVTAWILGLVKARPAWFSTLLAPLFVVSAVTSGLALVLVVAVAARGLLRARIPKEAIAGLARILFFALPVLGFFLFAELITVMFGGVPDEDIFFKDMMTGQYAWVFWFNVFGGIVLPWLILAAPRLRQRPAAVFLASLLVFLGVYAERFNLVVVPQFHKLLPHLHGSYAPTWVEGALTLGVAAALGLALMVFSRLVPLAEEDEAHAPARPAA